MTLSGRLRIVAAGVATLVVVAEAAGATGTPTAANMVLAPADVAGAKLVTQGKVTRTGYLSAYQRTLKLAKPYGRSEIVGVRATGAIAATSSQVTKDLASVQQVFASKVGRAAFVATIAGGFKVKAQAVHVSAIRHPKAGDGSVEIPLGIVLKGGSIYESLVFMRLDRVLDEFILVGARPIVLVDSTALAKIADGHIRQQLTPVNLAVPTITGTAASGQTLTGSPGTWSNIDVVVTYQWQRCDGTGANCAAIAGSTGSSYVVTDADANSTLRLVATATDRFGAPTATSAATAVVPAATPPAPAPGPGPG